MTAPFLLDLGNSHPFALWLAVCTGAAAFTLTLFTDHKLGVFRVLPYRFHLAVDLFVGVLFLLAPSIFGFAGLDAWYYWVNGAAVMLVVGLHRPEPVSSQVAVYASARAGACRGRRLDGPAAVHEDELHRPTRESALTG